MKKTNDSKEFLLLEIQGTQQWRHEKANQFPESREVNLHSAESIGKLAKYVESLPENHPVFYTFWNLYGDESKASDLEGVQEMIRQYGYQNQKDTPEEFVGWLIEEMSKH